MNLGFFIEFSGFIESVDAKIPLSYREGLLVEQGDFT